MNLNYIWLVGIGIIMLLIALVCAIDNSPPLLIKISMMVQDPPQTIQPVTQADLLTYGIIVQLFCALKAGIFVLWYFFSNNLTKTRKVKEMMKQAKYFKGAFLLYNLFALIAIIIQIVWVCKLCENKIFVENLNRDTKSPITISSYRTTLLVKVILIFVLYMVFFTFLSFLYYV